MFVPPDKLHNFHSSQWRFQLRIRTNHRQWLFFRLYMLCKLHRKYSIDLEDMAYTPMHLQKMTTRRRMGCTMHHSSSTFQLGTQYTVRLQFVGQLHTLLCTA